MTDCVFTTEQCKASGEKVPVGFKWLPSLIRKWSMDTPFAAGVRVRPSTQDLQTGFEYASSGGQSSGASEPRWPTTLGRTVRDGSITWTAVELSEASLVETIASSEWEVPTGLTGSDEGIEASAGAQSTTVTLADGAPGETYRVVNEITTSEGHEYRAVIELTIEPL